MTREDAFKKLEQTIGLYLISGNADDTYCGEWREILETLKIEPCGDCVSRQAVLDAISRIGLRKSDTKEVRAVAECLRAVEDLPQESCLKMRPATEQERESVNAYIDNISTPTGYTFWGKDGK